MVFEVGRRCTTAVPSRAQIKVDRHTVVANQCHGSAGHDGIWQPALSEEAERRRAVAERLTHQHSAPLAEELDREQ